MNQNPVSPAVVIPQAYPLEVVQDGELFLVVGWVRNPEDDPGDLVPLVVLRGEAVPGQKAFPLWAGGFDYQVAGARS